MKREKDTEELLEKDVDMDAEDAQDIDEDADDDLELLDIDNSDEEDSYQEEHKGSKFKFVHIGFGVLVVAVFVIMGIVLHKWNQGKQLEFSEDDISKQNNGYWDTEPLDFPIFFDPTRNEGYVDDGQLKVIMIGDETIGDVNDSSSLSGQLKELTGADVATASCQGMSYSISDKSYTVEHPEDAFSMYYFITCLVNNDFTLMENALDVMGETDGGIHYDFLNWARYLDYAHADVIILCCGRYDYLYGRDFEGYDKYSEQIFGTPNGMSGGMDGCIKMLRSNYPNAQIIVCSPSFFMTEDKKGNKIGADLCSYGKGGIGEYIVNMAGVSMDESVTFVDNYFGIEFNSINYEDYLLEDGKTANKVANEMIAKHLEKFFYYNL